MNFAFGRIRHGEDWRAIITLNVYRGIVACAAVAVLFYGVGDILFDVASPTLIRSISLAYLGQCGLTMIAALWRYPRLQLQMLFISLVDILFWSLLMLASTGLASGLGMLLITPVAAAGLLLPGRFASLVAACAAIAVIGQESLRALDASAPPAEFVQAGILGTIFFLAAGVAYGVSRRVAASEAEAAQRASEARDLAGLNRHIIEKMQIGAVVVNGRHEVELVNQAAIKLLEIDGSVPIGQPLDRLSFALERAYLHWNTHTTTASERVQVGSHALLPMFSRFEQGRDTATLIFLEDARRQSEQAQQLKLASIGRLSASIAHEIRNPLGAISHAAQLLGESDTLGDEEHRLLAIVHRHSRRIDTIIDSVMGLSRRSRTARRMLLLSNWLYDAVEDYSNVDDDAPDFEIDEFEEESQVEFDPDHLRQVLFNLWDNSKRYARCDDRELTIRMSGHVDRSNRLCLEVSDNGPGIDASIADQIMEPFFTTTRDGTGLGLHIASELCEANGAQLTLVAHSGEACFRIVFAHVWPVEPRTDSPHSPLTPA